jgi:hypothetical protein
LGAAALAQRLKDVPRRRTKTDTQKRRAGRTLFFLNGITAPFVKTFTQRSLTFWRLDVNIKRSLGISF